MFYLFAFNTLYLTEDDIQAFNQNGCAVTVPVDIHGMKSVLNAPDFTSR